MTVDAAKPAAILSERWSLAMEDTFNCTAGHARFDITSYVVDAGGTFITNVLVSLGYESLIQITINIRYDAGILAVDTSRDISGVAILPSGFTFSVSSSIASSGAGTLSITATQPSGYSYAATGDLPLFRINWQALKTGATIPYA